MAAVYSEAHYNLIKFRTNLKRLGEVYSELNNPIKCKTSLKILVAVCSQANHKVSIHRCFNQMAVTLLVSGVVIVVITEDYSTKLATFQPKEVVFSETNQMLIPHLAWLVFSVPSVQALLIRLLLMPRILAIYNLRLWLDLALLDSRILLRLCSKRGLERLTHKLFKMKSSGAKKIFTIRTSQRKV